MSELTEFEQGLHTAAGYLIRVAEEMERNANSSRMIRMKDPRDEQKKLYQCNQLEEKAAMFRRHVHCILKLRKPE